MRHINTGLIEKDKFGSVCVLKVLYWPYNFLVDVHTLNNLFVPEIKDQIVLFLINNWRYYNKKERALNKKCLQSYQEVSSTERDQRLF